MPVLFVTGGSRGIGAAVARGAAHDGYDVALTYVAERAAADAVVAGVEAAGRRGLAVRADVGEEGDVVAAFAAVDAAFGRLDAVVVNAAITGGFTRIDAIGAATLRRVLDVNVTGAFLCCREAVRRMSTAHGGRGGAIVVIGSRAADLGGPGEYVHYAASKAAAHTLAVGLGKEVAREGIRVVAVSPGIVTTEIHARGGRPERPAQAAANIPLARPGTPDEIAATVRWLLSPAASYVTATVVEVSGGR